MKVSGNGVPTFMPIGVPSAHGVFAHMTAARSKGPAFWGHG